MKALREIESRLILLSRKHKPGKWKPESYIGSEDKQFTFLNLKVPYIRDDREKGYSFSDRPSSKVWATWDSIWNQTKYFEVALSAAHFVNSRPIEEIYKNRKKLLRWQKRVDNWALSDELSNFYSRLLEFRRNEFLPTFEKWNVSRKPWEIRQSLVGLLFYSRFRKKPLPCAKILSLITPHLENSHYYVQKAIGWTLRECWNIYPAETMEYIENQAHLIPTGGWTAATEKLDKAVKKDLLNRRKKRKST